MRRVSRAFTAYRRAHNITLREVERATGVGKSTLTRFGQGKQILARDLAVLLAWLLHEEDPAKTQEWPWE
jgi:transcriptional regulator with XRE-family HTH domain